MHNATITMILGITAALLHGAAYLLYAVQTKVGRSSPKSASWGLWVFLTVLNWLTFDATIANWIITFQFLVSSVGCVATFIYILALRKLAWPKRREWRIIGIGVLAIFVWWILKNAAWANLIVFSALVISFIPTYQTLLADPRKDMPRSWILWTIAFLLTTTNVIVNWKGEPLALVMPIGGVILHGTVAFLSRRRRVYKFYKRTSADIFF